jgi:ubiquinone/menaquinone biosynthesis C-methylase UbiE
MIESHLWKNASGLATKMTHPLFYSMAVDRVMLGIRRYVPEFSGMKPGDKVLDVCCGTGAQVFLYARRGVISWGIDADSRMIEFAERRKARLGLGNTHFQRASAMNLPFKDASFDHASLSMGLHEKEGSSRERIIGEMRRVVKKNGTLVFVDYRVPYPRGTYPRVARVVERIAGKEHFGLFRAFLRDGGLDALLRRHHLREDERSYARRMPVVLLKARNV